MWCEQSGVFIQRLLPVWICLSLEEAATEDTVSVLGYQEMLSCLLQGKGNLPLSTCKQVKINSRWGKKNEQLLLPCVQIIDVKENNIF